MGNVPVAYKVRMDKTSDTNEVVKKNNQQYPTQTSSDMDRKS